MIFSFLRYLQPTHYFSLKRNSGAFIFPIPTSLPSQIESQLLRDERFSCDKASEYDLSWQAIKGGYIGDAMCYSEFDDLPIVDNYRFIRKYFSKFWVIYVLILRVLSFKNPVKEVRCYWQSSNVKDRMDLDRFGFKQLIIEDGDFSSVNEEPKISVIIPTLNRYAYLKDALSDIAKQSYSNFEVIIVDQSHPYNKKFYDQFDLDIRVIHQKERALWLARNTAIEQSSGDYILLYDDDSRVDEHWILNHLRCIQHFDAAISSGISISKVGAEVPDNYAYYRISDQLDTGNVLIKKEVFEAIGLFDRQFEGQRMGDGEFGLRAFLNDYKNISNPESKRLHLKVESGGLREMGSWDAFRTNRLFAPRPIPSVLYLFRRYFGETPAKLAIMRTVPFSIIPYKFKSNKLLMLLGILLSVIFIPLVVFQVLKSWRLSKLKLSKGPLIPIYKT